MDKIAFTLMMKSHIGSMENMSAGNCLTSQGIFFRCLIKGKTLSLQVFPWEAMELSEMDLNIPKTFQK